MSEQQGSASPSPSDKDQPAEGGEIPDAGPGADRFQPDESSEAAETD